MVCVCGVVCVRRAQRLEERKMETAQWYTAQHARMRGQVIRYDATLNVTKTARIRRSTHIVLSPACANLPALCRACYSYSTLRVLQRAR